LPGAKVSDLTGPATPDPIRARKLLDLVQEHDVSVRLGNALNWAEKAGKLPFMTIGDYLDAGTAAQTTMLREVRNFGSKSAQELDALIQVECAALGIDRSSDRQAVADPNATERAALIGLFEGDTIGAIASEEVLSTRLETVLSLPPFREMTFASAVESFPQTAHTIAHTRNCGRKSVKEFRQMCVRHIRRRLTEHGIGELDRLVTLILDNAARASQPRPDGESDKSDSADGVVVPEHALLAQRLEWLLTELDPRAAEILKRRSGIGQQGRQTLEDIGSDYRVTRERIRQIEAKSLRRLRTRIRRAPINHLLQQEGAAQWEVLARGRPVLKKADLFDRRRDVDAYVTLALDILNLALEQWIDTIALAFPEGWLHPSGDPSIVRAVAAALQDEIRQSRLPQAVVALTEADLKDAHAACELVLGHPIRYGYVMPPRVGTRLTRLVRLHALLATSGHARSIEQLLPDYHAHFPDDLCSERDAEIVMNAAPHLFLEIEEGSWLAIGLAGPRLKSQTPVKRPERNELEELGTIAHALQVTLQVRGPTRLSELLDDAGAILPQGRSVNSIGPVLLTRRELFVRVLPGVYALPEHVSTITANLPDEFPILFNDGQARLYALARYAGEPRRVFPFWTPTAELKLCRWARHSGDAGILDSLLAIAEPDLWPVDAAERESWHYIKRQQGRFALGSTLRHDAAYERPPLDRVLAACIYAQAEGALNWIAANRLTGRKIDSHGGAGLVALLVCLGVLTEPTGPGYRWQMRHTATSAVDVMCRRLTHELAHTGELDWTGGVGAELTDQVSHAARDTGSWVSPSAVMTMLEQPRELTLAEAGDDDPLERLMADRRRSREADQREATLQWLLAE